MLIKKVCSYKSDIVFLLELSDQCSTTGVTKAVVCVILSGAYNRTLAANWKEYLMWWQRVSSLTI